MGKLRGTLVGSEAVTDARHTISDAELETGWEELSTQV